ncbi:MULTISPECIES: hypothetical protein [Gibbsiella]|uniref:hypothetical protein n=1 Tax=Gibbsiella TaxID=929812 RepID=UPI0011C3E9FE|nr:hypothetical protein [Gibbsiella quercinecans]
MATMTDLFLALIIGCHQQYPSKTRPAIQRGNAFNNHYRKYFASSHCRQSGHPVNASLLYQAAKKNF